MAFYNLIGHLQRHDITDPVLLLAEKLHINILMLNLALIFFCQAFDLNKCKYKQLT